LVTIWLKRWPARPLIELPLFEAPVGLGEGVGVGGSGGSGVAEGEGEGDGDPQGSSAHCADAVCVCNETNNNVTAAVSAIEARMLSAVRIMVSARTGCQ
jgi:hypothetical protein